MTLYGIPLYFLLLFKILVSMCKALEKLMWDFLWEVVEEGGDSHLVSWAEVSKPKDYGGLGIRNWTTCNKPC